MSEVIDEIYQAANVSGLEYQAPLLDSPLDSSDPSEAEKKQQPTNQPNFINPEWDDTALTDFVAANANVLVRTDSGITTVSAAVSALPKSWWTAENQPNIIAYVEQLLARRVEEEPSEEENTAQAEEASKLEEVAQAEEVAQVDEDKSETEIVQQNLAEAETVTEKVIAPGIKSAESVEASRADKASVEADAYDASVQAEAAQPDGGTAKIQPVAALSSISKAAAKSPDLGKAAAEQAQIRPTAHLEATRKPAPSSLPTRSQNRLKDPGTTVRTGAEIRSRVPTADISRGLMTARELEDTIKMAAKLRPAANPIVEADQIHRDDEVTVLAAAGLEMFQPLNSEAAVFSNTGPETIGILAASSEGEPETAHHGLHSQYSELIDFVEGDEIIIEHFNKAQPANELRTNLLADGALEGPELEGDKLLDLVYTEPSLAEQIEPEVQVRSELPWPDFNEMENCLGELAERLKTSMPEENELATTIMHKIMAIPTGLDGHESMDAAAEAPALEAAESLFTELFETLGITYRPELMESLAKVVVSEEFNDEIGRLRAKVDDETPAASGTHEIIVQLVAGLNSMKDTLAQAYALGKSALKGYISLVLRPYDLTLAKAATPATMV